MPEPDRFLEIRSAGGVAFARAPLHDWVQSALARGDNLHEVAERTPGNRPMHGRGTVYLIEVEGVRCVVRRYLRGGGMRFLGDRYLRGGEARPERETSASEMAIARGIRTPRVLAWAVYPAGPFYRADLVTEYIPESSTLAALLFEVATSSDDRRRILEAAGSLLARMAGTGLHHTDLNARNILLQRIDDHFDVAVLDLDRMVVNTDGRPIDPAPMLERLERSIRKLSRGRSEGLSAADWRHLRAGVASQVHAGGDG